MYGRMWDRIPGPLPVRILITVLVAFVVLVVLFLWVFPALDARLSIDDSDVSSLGVVALGLI